MTSWRTTTRVIRGKRRRVKVRRYRGKDGKVHEQVRVLNYRNTSDGGKVHKGGKMKKRRLKKRTRRRR